MKSICVFYLLNTCLVAAVGVAAYAEEDIPVDPMTGEALAQSSSEAAHELDAANQLLQASDFADAVVAYVDVIEKYPETEQALAAFQGILLTDKAVTSNPALVEEVIGRLAAKLPPVSELTSPFARYNVCAFNYLYGNVQKGMGLMGEAEESYARCCKGVLQSMGECLNSPYNISFASLYMSAAERVYWDKGKQGAKDLADFAVSLPASVAKWSCHYALADYYLHEGKNRDIAEQYLSAMLAPDQFVPVSESLKTHVAADWIKAAINWAHGYAQMEMGQYDAAIAKFDEVVRRFGEVKAPGKWGGAIGQWAAVTKPLAVKLKNPDQPAIAADAYEAYLQDHADSDYVAFAYLELGNLYKAIGDYDKAKENYLEVIAEGNHWEASQAAVVMLNEMNSIQKSGEGK